MTAVITSYYPDARLQDVVTAALGSCATVIVIDNTPGTDRPAAADVLAQDDRVTLRRSGRNLGLAVALNTALRMLPAEADTVFFLDQDTVVPADLADRLRAHLSDSSVGAVGPTPVEPGSGRPYQRFGTTSSGLVEADSLITSGMLVRREVLDLAEGFRDDFFVDWVDNDFCLRARAAGARLVRDASVPLEHSIGRVVTHRLLGVRVRVVEYPPWRHYWILRNGIVLVRENARSAGPWAAAASLYMSRQAVTGALFGPDRRSVTRALSRGIRDGITGRVAAEYLMTGVPSDT